ncbi:MAG TPA: RHS repeat-associated core domain-containing protein [Chloroflexota bacterium]|nr:RHS repeat-associated core domain-containing protein [Chloroflexota bacterium]
MTTFGYDADSNLTTETFPAASTVVDTFTFNATDQMTNVASVKGGSTTLFSAGYSRDSANQLSSDSSAASGTGSYKYTPLNQVCYAGSSNSNACSSPPSGSIAYAYDAADNLTQKGSTQQAFNNADELCWTAATSGACGSPPSGATTYQFDTRGNRTTVTPSGGQAQALTYDQANRLTKYAAASTTSYGYNGDGLRMCKYAGSSTQPCSAMGTTEYLWDVAGALPLLLKDGSTAYVYGPGGLPLEQVNSSATYWFHHDQIGSTRLVTDSTGSTSATYTFDPYGGLASSTGSITNPFRFQGQYQDAETGWYYLRLRYFDSNTGQFLSADALTSLTRLPYAYVVGNPLNRTDPTGLCWPSWACGFENKVGGAISSATSAVATAGSDAVQWAKDNQDTIGTVATVLAIVGVACGLGIITAETSCLIVGIAALGLGAVQMGIDASEGNWTMFGIDAFGEVTGLGGLRAAAGGAKAVFWALSGLCDARASWQASHPPQHRRPGRYA